MIPRFDIAKSIGSMAVAAPGRSETLLIEAISFRQRALGLMGRWLQRLPQGTGVLFTRCTCVHTFGMRGPISLTWIREEVGGPERTIKAVSIDASVPPNRIVWGPRGATGVVEARPVDRCEELIDERLITFSLS